VCEKKRETRLGAGSRPSAAGAGSFKWGGWRTGDEIDRSSQLAAEIPSLGKTMGHPRLLIIKLIRKFIGRASLSVFRLDEYSAIIRNDALKKHFNRY
jgi:hypothetical protein